MKVLRSLIAIILILLLLVIPLSADMFDVALEKRVTGYTYYHNFLINTLIKSGFYMNAGETATVLELIDEKIQEWMPTDYQRIIELFPREYDMVSYDYYPGWESGQLWAPPGLEMDAETHLEWYMKHVHEGFFYPDFERDDEITRLRREIIYMVRIMVDADNGRLTIAIGERVEPTLYTPYQIHMVSPDIFTDFGGLKPFRTFDVTYDGADKIVYDYCFEHVLSTGAVNKNYLRIILEEKQILPRNGGYMMYWPYKPIWYSGVPAFVMSDGNPIITGVTESKDGYGLISGTGAQSSYTAYGISSEFSRFMAVTWDPLVHYLDLAITLRVIILTVTMI